MNTLRHQQHSRGLADWDNVGEPAGAVVVTHTCTQESIAPDVSRVIYVLAGLREWLEAAGYAVEDTLTLSGPLNVTIDL